MYTELNDIKRILKDNSLRITKPRLAVAEVLLAHPGQYFTSEEIFDRIIRVEGQSCDQVSVYRILARFEALEIVKRNDFNGEASRYGLSSKEHSSHHEHFFKCIACNFIEPFKGCFVSKKEKELEKDGYRNLIHHLEITGLCPSCA